MLQCLSMLVNARIAIRRVVVIFSARQGGSDRNLLEARSICIPAEIERWIVSGGAADKGGVVRIFSLKWLYVINKIIKNTSILVFLFRLRSEDTHWDWKSTTKTECEEGVHYYKGRYGGFSFFWGG